MKDPAFLFYTKDFFEGTRLMLPSERACYIDLLIYQHQHGLIPLESERLLMYCAGINEATLQATLQAKFKRTDKGWYNEKLKKVIEDRTEYASKQSENGLIGQFFKKAKAALNSQKFKELKEFIYFKYGKETLIEELKKNDVTHEGLLQALLKHLVNVNAIVNEDVNKNPSLEKSEKPFLKNVSVPWQSDNDFQEIYKQWIDMRMDEHGEDWRDGQHSMLMKELKLYSKHDAMAAISRAIQGNYKVIYPSHSKGNSTEQVLKDLGKKPPPPVMQDSRWEVEKRGNEYFFVEFDGFNKKSGRERKATEHDYQRAQTVS